MYPNNIYVKNYEEIKKLTGDIGVQLTSTTTITTSSTMR